MKLFPCTVVLTGCLAASLGARVLSAPATSPQTTPADAAATNPSTPTRHPALRDFPVSKTPYLGAYHWGAANANGGARANEAFARWIKQPIVWAEDFEPTEQWENNIEGGGWQLGEWRDWKATNPRRRLILSVPMLPGGWDRSGAKGGTGAGPPVSYEAGAKGDYNTHFKNLAQNLVDYKLGDSVIRLGWEFNGGWYTWRASDNPGQWAAYWRQIVTAMRSVKGAEKLQFCWNPALGWQQFPSDQAWPGDEFVDIVGLDVYDDSWAGDTYPLPDKATPEDIAARREKAWNEVIYGGQFGLKFWRDWAQTHGKLFALPEWGVSKREDGHGGLDNPVFIEKMGAFINDPSNNVYFHCYFDVQAGDGHHQLSPGLSEKEEIDFPLSSAKFREIFVAPIVAPVPVVPHKPAPVKPRARTPVAPHKAASVTPRRTLPGIAPQSAGHTAARRARRASLNQKLKAAPQRSGAVFRHLFPHLFPCSKHELRSSQRADFWLQVRPRQPRRGGTGHAVKADCFIQISIDGGASVPASASIVDATHIRLQAATPATKSVTITYQAGAPGQNHGRETTKAQAGTDNAGTDALQAEMKN